MAVSHEDVIHVARLARVAIDPTRLPQLVRELNSILEHMDALQSVPGKAAMTVRGPDVSLMRSDVSGLSVPLDVTREEFAPEMRDGFFLVPRLATHEGEGERSP